MLEMAQNGSKWLPFGLTPCGISADTWCPNAPKKKHNLNACPDPLGLTLGLGQIALWAQAQWLPGAQAQCFPLMLPQLL